MLSSDKLSDEAEGLGAPVPPGKNARLAEYQVAAAQGNLHACAGDRGSIGLPVASTGHE